MRVAVYYNNHDIRLEDIAIPKIGDGELLIKVFASGICGTDTMEWYRVEKAPRVLGHEITGQIAESKSNKYKVGQRVFVSHHVACNNCKYCLAGNQTACDVLHKGNYDPGGYSEYIRVPKINVDNGVYVLPDNVSYEEGTLIEPLACTIRGQNVIDLKKGEKVLILGSGVSGLLNIQLARLRGARAVATDINGYRLEKAKSFGAHEVIDAGKDFNIDADKVIICTAAIGATKQAFRSVDRKGTILFFAVPGKSLEIPIVEVWRNEITITSTYGASSADLEEALRLIEKRIVDVKSLVTHSFPMENVQEGYDTVSRAEKSLKVVLKPNV